MWIPKHVKHFNSSIDSIQSHVTVNVLNIFTDIYFDSGSKSEKKKSRGKIFARIVAFISQNAEASKLSVNVKLLTFAITMLQIHWNLALHHSHTCCERSLVDLFALIVSSMKNEDVSGVDVQASNKNWTKKKKNIKECHCWLVWLFIAIAMTQTHTQIHEDAMQ